MMVGAYDLRSKGPLSPRRTPIQRVRLGAAPDYNSDTVDVRAGRSSAASAD